ncbi:MAG: immunoglobulin domain-containing protein [Verrucomicrobia bacterium]|nr:immunoglobulin domain-containing protein [Verrucomicrobiota bacterium]
MKTSPRVTPFCGCVGVALLALAGAASAARADAPANDHFANATVITGTTAQVTGNNTNATTESGEPLHSPDYGTGSTSVWWRWTAPQAGYFGLNTIGSSFDTQLAVYTGNSLGSLVRVADNDEESGGTTASALTFLATAGTTYSIAVSGYAGAWGPIALNLGPAVVVTPYQHVADGANFTLAATGATGAVPLSYQWRRGGVAIDGASSANHPLSNLSLANAGRYDLVLTDGTGSGRVLAPSVVQLNTTSAGVAKVFAGSYHLLVLKTNGTLWAAGYNGHGQLGDGTTTTRTALVQVASNVVTAAAGTSHSLFVKADGSLWAMGYNSDGELGDGTFTNQVTPVQIRAAGVTGVWSGFYSWVSFFSTSDGKFWGMGWNTSGQLGDGSTQSRGTPVEITTGVVDASAGYYHSVFVKADGALLGAGSNTYGELAGAPSAGNSTPVQLATGVARVSAGNATTVFLKSNGELWGLGYNGYRQLGNNGANATAPVLIATSVTAAAAGYSHTVFTRTDGQLHGVGNGSNGEIGDTVGVAGARHTPGLIARDAQAMAAVATNCTYYVTQAGGLWATGRNSSGQFANGLASSTHSVPTQIHAGVAAVPVIVTQPQASAVPSGQPAAFSVVATGTLPLSYQWRKGGVAINGATASSYSIASTVVADAAAYTVVVTDIAGPTTSSTATLDVLYPPSFTTTPTPQIVVAGNTATFAAAASGNPAPSFQWKKNGTDIPGATNATLTIANAQPADAADYVVRITNSQGFTESSPCALTVRVLPVFTTQPQSQIAAVGATVTLTVAASGTPTPTLQWKKNNIVRAGATSATLTLANVQLSDAGNYHAVASNSAGDTASDLAALTVIPANWVIVDSTYNGITPAGSGNYASNQNTGLNSQGNRLANSFTTGAAAVDLQSVTLGLYTHMGLTDAWSLRVCADASGSPGAVLATLANPVGAPAWTEGNFAFAATTPLRLTASTTYWLLLEPAYSGTDAMLLWKSGGNRQGITISDRASDRASWAAWRGIGNQASNAFVVYGTAVATVAPAITTQPVSQTVNVGANVTFSVVATGTPAPAFQWKKDGTDIPNATLSTLTLNNVQAGAAGSYTVVVSNGTLPNATSSAATLTVNAAPVVPVITSNATATAVANVAFTYSIVATPGPLTGYGLTGTLPSGLTFTNSTGVISGTTAAVGTYPVTLTATNAAGTSAGFAFTLTVSSAAAAPIVTTQPQTQTVLPGATVTFSVAASGLTPLSYQWTKNYSTLPNGATASGAVISGAQTATLTLTGVQASDVGNYQVVVTNPVGYTQSNLATLTVGTTGVAPTLTSQMRSRTAVVGQNVVFSVTAVGSPTLTYQWKKDGSPIDGATNADYVIANVQPTDAASYLVRVTNTYGYAEPQAMKLTVASAAPANDSFANAASLAGGTASATGSNIGASFETGEPDHSGFGETGHNHGGYSVWWQWTAPAAGVAEFTVTPSGTGFEPLMSVYTGSSVDALTRLGAAQLNKVAFYAVSGTTYRIAVDGYFGATGNFSLAVAAGTAVPLQITVQPMNQSVPPGTNALFHLFTQGTGPISYQWKKGTTALVNGANISGTTSNMLVISSAQPADAGSYTCVVSNPVDTITSVVVTLTVADPVIGYPPQSQTVAAGATVNFYVSASGTAPLTYQWKKGTTALTNGGNIAGATTNNLTLTNVQAADAGDYTVVVTNGASATATSPIATLTVTAGATAPANDNFANAQVVTGTSGTTTGTNVGATGETGEPAHYNSSGTASSVWYKWTAPQSGTMVFDTIGSNFDTVMAAYSGTALASLTQLAQDDEGGGSATSKVTFNVTAGVDYYIAVGSWGSTRGSITLNWQMGGLAPANDNFANAQVVTGGTGTTTGTNVGATGETGEPTHYSSGGTSSSVWYRWTATVTGSVVFDTIGSSFDTVMAAYSGSALASLTQLAQDDDSGGVGATSKVAFNVTSGTVYHIAVGGYGSGRGNITFNWLASTTPIGGGTLPAITSAGVATATVGTAFSFQVTASNSPTSFALTGTLPAGVTFNTTTGLIAGTPTAAGSFPVSLTATNGSGTSPAATLTITVIPSVMLVEDGFTGAAGAAPDASKFEWSGELAQTGSGTLNLLTQSVQSSWLRSKAGAAVGAGETLVLQMRAYAYAEGTSPGIVYGDKQPRGLRVGSDPNNAVEFYSASRTSLGMRVRKDGIESQATYALPAGVDMMHDYEITVTTASVVFRVDGVVAGTITTNIPTGVLNVYVSSDDGGGVGNVPVTIDSLSLTLLGRTAAAGLIGHWAGEGNTADATGRNPAGVIHGGVTYAAGRAGQAFAFGGTDGWIDLGSQTGDFGTANFTIALWVRFNDLTREQTLIEDYVETESAARTGWSIGLRDGRVSFGFNGSQQFVSQQVATGTWYHVALTHDSAWRFFELYLNGVWQASGAHGFNPDLSSTATLKLGHRGNPTDTPGSVDTRGFFLNGALDEVRIYSRALGVTELQTLAVFGPVIETQPVAQTVNAGANVTFSVVATGTAPLTYQWKKGTTPLTDGGGIAGATTATLTLGNVQTADTGSYVVVVTGAAGPVTSNPAWLTVNASNLAASSGFAAGVEGWGVASFSSLATENYAVVGNYTPTFVATGGNPGGYLSMNDPDGGDFTFSAPAAFLGNRLGSLGATLTYELIHPVGTLNYPAVDVILVGNGVRLVWQGSPAIAPSASAWTPVTVTLAPSAQWHVGSTSGAAATVADFQNVLGNLTGLFIRGEYTDGPDTTGLDNVVLGVAPAVAPTITTQPVSASVATAATATFTVAATGTPAPGFRWQGSFDGGLTWSDLPDGAPFGGVTTATLTVSGVSVSFSRAQFRCIVSNSAGPVTSAIVSLRVAPAAVGFGGSDDFAATTANWSVPVVFSGNGRLPLANNRLEYTVAAGTANDGALREWTANVGSYTRDWSVQVDVHLASLTLPSGQFANLNLMVLRADDALKPFNQMNWMGVAIDRYGNGGATVHNFEGSQFGNGNRSPATGVIEVLNNSTDATLRISFNATTKELTSWYDADGATNGFTWTQLQSINIGSGTYTWGMTDSGTFAVVLAGGSGGVALTSGQAWFDNFLASEATGAAPVITTQPAAQTVVIGGTATFNVVATGTPPLTYQWKLGPIALTNGPNISGATSATLTITGVQPADAGLYTCVVSSGASSTTSAAAQLSVASSAQPPVITSLPRQQTALVGGTVTFAVSVAGTPPFTYQWKKNTENIPNATSATLTLTNVQLSDAASYTVQVTGTTTITSSPFVLTVAATGPANDQFANALALTGATTSATGSNIAATFEPGEPDHIGHAEPGFNHGGNSVWWQWTAPATGAVALDTIGSGFDTLLAVYTGPSVSALTLVGADDQAGGNGTSALSFAATAGVTYYFAVDGYFGATGAIQLHLAPTTAAAPSFHSHPIGQTVAAGMNVAFSASIRGTAPFTYQWQKDNADIPGATGLVLKLANVPASAAGNYTLKVTNALTTVTSNAAVLTVSGEVGPPSLVLQPQSQTVTAGGVAMFSVSVVGTPPLTFQWKKGGTALANGTAANAATVSGATTATLTLTGVQTSDAGNYTCYVANTPGNATSSIATLTVNPVTGTPPTVAITSPAAGSSSVLGASVTIAATASDADGTIASVEFFANGVSLGVDTTAPYSVTVTPSASGAYALTAKATDNSGLSTTSAAVSVTVTVPVPVITSATSVTATVGLTFNYPITATNSPTSFAATGTLPAGVAFSSSTGAFSGTPTAAGSFPLTVTASNAGGMSAAVTLTITVSAAGVAPTFATHPSNQTVNAGATATFTVAANGAPTPTLQWQRQATGTSTFANLADGGGYSGATTATLTVAGTTTAMSGDQFRCVATNGVSPAATSNAATLTVNSVATAPTITVHPASQAVSVGAALTLTVGASGTTPFTYQWKKGGQNLDGATNATFTIASVTTADAGSYTVVVTNTAGSSPASNAAVITVLSGTYGATHAVVGAGYQAGGTVTITNTITYATPPSVSALGWNVLLPDGWSFASTTSGDSPPQAGDTGALTWAWLTIPASGHTFTYTLNVPAGATGTQSIVAYLELRQNSTSYAFLAKPDPLPVSKVSFHSADTMGATAGSAPDSKINLSELLRVIELYNYRAGTVRTGQYTMGQGTEDGFAPGPNGATLTAYHSADTMGTSAGTPRDGRINLSELLRVIELYNYRAGTVRTGQYHIQSGTEDGFAPGP